MIIYKPSNKQNPIKPAKNTDFLYRQQNMFLHKQVFASRLGRTTNPFTPAKVILNLAHI